jgi:hypothetical protein
MNENRKLVELRCIVKSKYSGEKTYPRATLSITNPTYKGVGLNLVLHKDKSVLTVWAMARPSFLLCFHYLMCPLILGQFVHRVYCFKTVQTHLKCKGEAMFEQAYYRRRGFQDVEAPRFQESQYMNLLMMSGLSTSSLCPPGNIPGNFIICVRDWVDLRAIVQPDGSCRWKILMIPGTEPATFRVVASTNCFTSCFKTHSRYIYIELKLVPCIMAFVSIFVDT